MQTPACIQLHYDASECRDLPTPRPGLDADPSPISCTLLDPNPKAPLPDRSEGWH